VAFPKLLLSPMPLRWIVEQAFAMANIFSLRVSFFFNGLPPPTSRSSYRSRAVQVSPTGTIEKFLASFYFGKRASRRS